MPLVIDGGRVPTRWAEKNRLLPDLPAEWNVNGPEWVRIALINNMPDPALEDTEFQFFELLDTAADHVPVCVKLFSLPGVRRGSQGEQHLGAFYHGMEDLWNGRFDAVIMTGTEPQKPDLRQELYWPALADVLDWAERNTASAVLSCLASHAGVLHSDGITRHAMADKVCGVFASQRTADHALTHLAPELMRFPHSRWNEVREDDLTACGYLVLTRSAEAGVDWFVKRKGKSLMVHYQGHPEYGAQTLFKEYRRDVKRFLAGERKTYPTMPHGYFDAAAARMMAEFQAKALCDPREELMAGFPEAAVTGILKKTWAGAAWCVYRNWLHYLVSRKADALASPVISRVELDYGERKRFVTSER